ncbi:MAG: hypothetical protein ABIJ18_02360 [archaeon]
MDFEKRLLIFSGIILGIVAILSFSGAFTGFAVQESDNTVEYKDVLAGSIIKGELDVEIIGDGIVNEVVEVSGDGAEWVEYKREYVFIPGVVNRIPYTINIPEDVENGIYRIGFTVISVKDFEKTDLISNQVLYSVDLLLYVDDTVRRGFQVNDFEVYDSEDRVDFSMNVVNEGNVEEDMEIKVIVQNENYVTEKKFNGILNSYESQKIDANFMADLEDGEYTADVYVKIGDLRKKISDDFIISQDLVKRAELLGTNVYVKDNNVYVTSIVKNTGDSVLDANLRGEVGGVEFNSEEKSIMPGDYDTFEYDISIDEEGNYLLKSEVIYDNIVLGQQETWFYVSDKGIVSLEISFIAILGFIVLALLVSHYVLNKKLKGGKDRN